MWFKTCTVEQHSIECQMSRLLWVGTEQCASDGDWLENFRPFFAANQINPRLVSANSLLCVVIGSY